MYFRLSNYPLIKSVAGLVAFFNFWSEKEGEITYGKLKYIKLS